jgi:ATP-dependent DNA helicase RecG
LTPISAITLDTAVDNLKGIGPKKARALKSASISKLIDLLRLTPSGYQDRSKTIPVANLVADGTSQGFFVVRLDKLQSFHARRGLTIISAAFSDSSGKIQAKWFNKTYLTRQLKTGQKYWLYGPVITQAKKPTLSNPEIESYNEQQQPGANGLTPVYPTRSALSEARISPLSLRKLIASVIDKIDWENSFPSYDEKSPFRPIARALQQIHRPNDLQAAKRAEFTLAFFDQVLFQIGVLKRRESLTGTLSLPGQKRDRPYKANIPLPFMLTRAQQRVLSELIEDLQPEEGKPPMNRLLQGDVGCGKTLVAFLAMLEFSNKLSPGSQAVFMAPTEVLARQHLAGFKQFFPEFADQSIILTGSQKSQERKQAFNGIATGNFKYVFGTHALFQEKINFAALEFCIIDEQQRFGVNHRRLLTRKGKHPHQLLLSATPIPRTLSLTIFGDMDTSIIDELPPGRSPIKTALASSLKETAPFIKDNFLQGNKTYVVCPLIEISEKTDWTSVEEAALILTELLPETRIALLTGQNSWEEKELVMKNFKEGMIDILIATTVIEVGIDHPDATLMIIENADRFGLSQLHQLRGRVGRSDKKSQCLLVSHQAESCERLALLTSTTDGFALAAEDLRLRGPGDLVGTRQSGLSHPCFSHNISAKMLENARRRAFEILTSENKLVKNWFVDKMIDSFADSYKTFMEGG